MSREVDLLQQAATIVLPSPERTASISIAEIDGEEYVRIAVEVSRSMSVTRLVRLRDVSAFHDGPFKLDTRAVTLWQRGERAQRQLKANDSHTGFVAVHKGAQIALQIEMGTTAAESYVIEELVLRRGPIVDRGCDPCDRDPCC